MKKNIVERVRVEGLGLKTVYCYKCEGCKWEVIKLWNKDKTKIEGYKYTCVECKNEVYE